MQILLLGATGRTGTIVLREALQRAHAVTALVRDPSTLDNLTPALKSNLTLVRGSPLNASDVAAAVKAAAAASHGDGPLAVISTLNPRRASNNPWAAAHPTDSPPRMMADSLANVLSALPAATPDAEQQPKIVHLSALGVGSSASQAPWALRALVAHSNMKLTYADHEAAEAELREAEGVAWVSVRANRLVEGAGGAGKSIARVWTAEKGTVGMMATSSREAVARFLVDAAESRKWDGQAPIIVG